MQWLSGGVGVGAGMEGVGVRHEETFAETASELSQQFRILAEQSLPCGLLHVCHN